MLINLRNALMTGKRMPTAKDYVQDGLVAMWDAIENVGWGTHNQSAQAWIDLIGNRQISANGNVWGTNFINVNGRTKRLTIPNFSALAQTAVTYEFVCKLNSAQSNQFGRMFNSRVGDSRIFGIYSGNPATFARMEILYSNYAAADTKAIDLRSVHNYAFTYGSSGGVAYLDGNPSAFPAIGNLGSFQIASTAQIGAQSGGQTWVNLDCYAFRVSSRALTIDEIERNYKIDKERFNLP